jgi:hypothetical protein
MRNDAMSLSPMDIVKQTGTTIIFEEFDSADNKMDLITLLTKDDEKLPIEKFRNLIMGENSELVVKSFSEFEEKFSPIIYETMVLANGKAKFVYKLDKPKHGDFTKINLKDHAFYKMIKNILDGKSHSDNANLDFNYDEFKKALSPKESIEECKKIRKRLLVNTKQYNELIESGIPSVEIKRLEKNIVEIRKKIIDKYDNKSPLNLLPILIADKQRQIDFFNEQQNTVSGSLGSETKVIRCTPVFTEKGNIGYKKYEDKDEANKVEVPAESKEQTYLETVAGVLKNDFKTYAPAEYKDNNFVAGMIADAYTGGGGKTVISTDLIKIEEEKAELQDIYKDSQESFAKAVIDIVQRFIGVKSFFDHAAYKGKLGRNIKLIVANCKYNKLLADDVAKDRFKFYFNAFSNEKDVNRIWFGIVPSVRFDDCGSDSSVDNTCFGGAFGEINPSSDKVKKMDDSGSQLDSLKEMLSLLTDAKIMAFTNDKAGKDTGFVSINADKVRDYDDALKSVNSEYAVFCYPNFTILPEEKTAVKIGYKLESDSKRDEYCELPGVYLDSSYVACGMVVGIQNYEFLKSKGFNVDSRFPCVRFSLEDGEHCKVVTTNLNRETTTEMLKETKAAISEYRFGFAFADNRIIYKDKILNNSYVINERTLKRNDKDIYKPVCWTLVKNTVDQMLRSIDDNLSRNTFNMFKREYLDSWKRDSKDDSKRFDNRILLDGESIDLVEGVAKKLNLRFTFNGDTEICDDIVFTEQTEDNNGGN